MLKIEFTGPVTVQLNSEQLNRIEAFVLSLTNQGARIMSTLDTISDDVAANHDVVQSAVTLLSGIADRIKAAGTDPVKLEKLHTDLTSDTRTLAEAVAANTPASPGDIPPA